MSIVAIAWHLINKGTIDNINQLLVAVDGI